MSRVYQMICKMIGAGLLTVLLVALISGCGGGGGSSSEDGPAVNPPGPTTCGSNCFLTPSEVETIIAQAVAEASARDIDATVAVVDRVGNVLAVFKTSGASDFVTITSTNEVGADIQGGLERLNFVPASLAAISKAITGAYLSTGGNAFTTRTASQIIQENFNPGEDNVPSGPLFGVQFSQLACSDFSQRFQNGAASTPGPHRAPLGLSADPGGLPLYKDGVAIGGIGVVADGIYGLDKIISNFDLDLDELIATSATRGFAAPLDIRADKITILGKTAKFSDVLISDLLSGLDDVVSLASIVANNQGEYFAVNGYFDGIGARTGTAFGQPGSGIRAADAAVFKDAAGATLDAFIFVDQSDQNRYPAIAATDQPGGSAANSMTAAEVQMILNEAIDIANQSRAQIRVPAGTQARVTVSVVDTNGNILGMGRTRDGPVFGADVSLQKARTATFFSGSGRIDGRAPADILRGLPDPLYLAPLPEPVDLGQLGTLANPAPSLGRYVLDAQIFLGDGDALEATGGPVAFSDRAGGNLSRPRYPDGPEGGPPGPFSKPQGEWSIFSVGFQLDLVYNSIVQHLAFVFGIAPDVPQNCMGNTGLAANDPFTVQGAVTNLANGIQIFPGSVPVYRNNILIGGVGVSGDGVDQDDMISFLGVHRAGLRLNTGLQNAPIEIRADRLNIPGQDSRLRYVNCPQVPFIGSNDTEVCNGK